MGIISNIAKGIGTFGIVSYVSNFFNPTPAQSEVTITHPNKTIEIQMKADINKGVINFPRAERSNTSHEPRSASITYDYQNEKGIVINALWNGLISQQYNLTSKKQISKHKAEFEREVGPYEVFAKVASGMIDEGKIDCYNQFERKWRTALTKHQIELKLNEAKEEYDRKLEEIDTRDTYNITVINEKTIESPPEKKPPKKPPKGPKDKSYSVSLEGGAGGGGIREEMPGDIHARAQGWTYEGGLTLNKNLGPLRFELNVHQDGSVGDCSIYEINGTEKNRVGNVNFVNREGSIKLGNDQNVNDGLLLSALAQISQEFQTTTYDPRNGNTNPDVYTDEKTIPFIGGKAGFRWTLEDGRNSGERLQLTLGANGAYALAAEEIEGSSTGNGNEGSSNFINSFMYGGHLNLIQGANQDGSMRNFALDVDVMHQNNARYTGTNATVGVQKKIFDTKHLDMGLVVEVYGAKGTNEYGPDGMGNPITRNAVDYGGMLKLKLNF